MSENQQYTISAQRRTKSGTSEARRYRREGMVPAVVYGHGQPAVPLLLEKQALMPLLHHHGLVTVQVPEDGSNINAILKEIQRDVLNPNRVLHVDMQEVRTDEKITATVPIEATGEAAGTRAGGVLNQILHEIDVESLPADIPEMIEVDVSELDIDQGISVGELTFPEGVEPVVDPDEQVFQMALPQIIEEEEEAEEGEEGEELAGEAEPEVIGKGKAEEEE